MGWRAVNGFGVDSRSYVACIQIRSYLSLRPECEFLFRKMARSEAVIEVSDLHGITESLELIMVTGGIIVSNGMQW